MGQENLHSLRSLAQQRFCSREPSSSAGWLCHTVLQGVSGAWAFRPGALPPRLLFQPGLRGKSAGPDPGYLAGVLLVSGEPALVCNIDPIRAKPLQIGALLVVDIFTKKSVSQYFSYSLA